MAGLNFGKHHERVMQVIGSALLNVPAEQLEALSNHPCLAEFAARLVQLDPREFARWVFVLEEYAQLKLSDIFARVRDPMVFMDLVDPAARIDRDAIRAAIGLPPLPPV